MHSKIIFRTIATLLMISINLPVTSMANDKVLRMGVYENPPKILLTSDHMASGIFGDLITEIAKNEGYEIIPVPCVWLNCLNELKQGQIDLLPDVAYTEARAKELEFHSIPVLNSWSAFYVHKNSNIESILDLKGKRIAILTGSVQADYVRQMVLDFGIHVTFVPVNKFEEGFALLASNHVDTVVSNNFYGDQQIGHLGLSAPIMFLPSRLFFASKKNENKELLNRIDFYLGKWKAEENSPYFKISRKWMTEEPGKEMPVWLEYVAIASGSGILLVMIYALILRIRILRQSREQKFDLKLRQKVEEELAQNKAFFQSLLHTLPDPVWLKNPEGIYLACNTRFEQFFGARESEIIGKTDFDFVDEKLAQFFRINDQNVLSSRKLQRDEEWLSFASDGYKGLFETTKTPMYNSHGEIIGVLGIAHDITIRKFTEDSLKSNELRYRTLVEATSAIIWHCPPSGQHNEPQPLWMHFTGQSADEMLDSGWSDAIHPDDREFSNKQWAHSIKSGEPFNLEHRLRRQDGEWRWMSVFATPIRDESGNIIEWFGMNLDITDRKVAEEKVSHLAYFDQITNLPNRALFLDRLGQAIASTKRMQRFGAVMFVDLDHFKRINDVYGHEIGDIVLQEAALRIRMTLRQGDTLARFGGDEFVILLADISQDLETATSVAFAVGEKVRSGMDKPFSIQAHQHHVSVSIGITLFPKQTENMEDLIREADIAMYRAKECGRNSLIFFESDMQAQIAEHHALQQDLRDAIRKNELQLYLQSKVNREGKVAGAEVLLRWIHPEKGMVSPASFIPLAEESGLIVQIGEWVLAEACKLLSRISAAGKSLHLAVNVSPRQFHQANFVSRIKEILLQTGADPVYITLEITESLLVDRTNEIVSRMLELEEIGIRFSIDDFGTGYSSLAYLKRLPLNELKIDKSFIQDIPGDPNDVALVDTILSMAHHFGFKVVAEGVETQEQHAFLSSRNCEYFQGYLFNRPQSAQAWLDQWMQAN